MEHSVRRQRLSRIGIATIAASAPVAGALAVAGPAGASYQPTLLCGSVSNDTLACLSNSEGESQGNTYYNITGEGKNDNSYAFTGHFEFLYDNAGTWTFFSNSTEANFQSGGGEVILGGGELTYPVADAQKVILWKDSGSTHTEMSSVVQ